MFITVLFIIVTSTLILFRKKREKNWVNLISILTAPYLILVFTNNFFVVKTGFYKISDNVLLMLLVSLCLFYIGSLPYNIRSSFLNKENDNIEKFERYNMELMIGFLYVVSIVGLIKIIFLFINGAFTTSNIDASEGVMGSGIVGHLLLASYAVLPIVFLYWTYNMKLKYLFPILMILAITFTTLVKYNIIGVFVSIFIFLLLYKKSILKKAIIILVATVFFIFFANYALTFAIKQTTVHYSFYLGHLWTYLSGSLIYDNYIFTIGIRTDIGIGYKLMTFLCALPNMFINKLFGITLFPHEKQNAQWTSSFGESSNVVDAIGYLFPSKGNMMDMVIFGLVILFIGLVFAGIYKRNMRKSRYFNTFIANFLCYFVFFSFFGTFYINSAPWEILVYSIILPHLFYRKKRNKYGISRFNNISRFL